MSMSCQAINQTQQKSKSKVSFFESQLLLLESRKKWGILYSFATITGIFCIPGILSTINETDIFTLVQRVAVLPVISMLMATGMYILNDLVDADLDRANKKIRPIASGQVSIRQAWMFIIISNGAAIVLAIITFNMITNVIVILMFTIGILYSAPKIALMKRFLLKTLSIAIFYVLCALLSITSTSGLHLATLNPAVAVHTLITLGIMIFISSTLNDLGDVEGDKAVGRRTIPIVIGYNNTVKLMMLLIASLMNISWISIGLLGVKGLISAVVISLFGIFVLSILSKLQAGMGEIDSDLMRKQHRKLFPLHFVLQSCLVISSLILSQELSIHF
jgi:4-hydroxybenzoate polyprenyltransferase